VANHVLAIYFYTNDFLLGTLKIDYTNFYFFNVATMYYRKKLEKCGQWVKLWPTLFKTPSIQLMKR
jgi:hypothetical protein